MGGRVNSGQASNGMTGEEGLTSARPIRRAFRGRSTAGTDMYLRSAKEGQSHIYGQPARPMTPVCSRQDLHQTGRCAKSAKSGVTPLPDGVRAGGLGAGGADPNGECGLWNAEWPANADVPRTAVLSGGAETGDGRRGRSLRLVILYPCEEERVNVANNSLCPNNGGRSCKYAIPPVPGEILQLVRRDVGRI
jgi:hypothetical protein